jgi:26S proteasome regulatory subunit N6
MSSATSKTLAEADSLANSNPTRAETLYKQILSTETTKSEDAQEHAARLRDQEAALVNLGKMYRDHKYVDIYERNTRHVYQASIQEREITG